MCWLIGVGVEAGEWQRHTARDCTAYAELKGRDLDVFRCDGHILLCMLNRQVFSIAVSMISKIPSICLTSSGRKLRCRAGQTIKHERERKRARRAEHWCKPGVPADQPLCARLTVCYIAGLPQRGYSVPNSGCGPWKRITLLTRSDDRALCHQSINECDYL